MNRFAPLIRSTLQRLDLPQPIKANLIVELAADLQDLYEHLLERGASEDEAYAQACERFNPSEEALRRLVEVHGSPVRRLLEHLSERTRSRWERALMVGLTAFAAVMSVEVMMGNRFFLDASPMMWAVVVLGLLAAVLVAAKAYGLYIKQDHDLRRARWGLPTLLWVAIFCPVLGCFTLVAELMGLAFAVYPTPERAFAGVVLTMARVAPVMIVSLMVAALATICWFVLFRTTRRLEQEESRALIESGAAEAAGGGA